MIKVLDAGYGIDHNTASEAASTSHAPVKYFYLPTSDVPHPPSRVWVIDSHAPPSDQGQTQEIAVEIQRYQRIISYQCKVIDAQHRALQGLQCEVGELHAVPNTLGPGECKRACNSPGPIRTERRSRGHHVLPKPK